MSILSAASAIVPFHMKTIARIKKQLYMAVGAKLLPGQGRPRPLPQMLFILDLHLNQAHLRLDLAMCLVPVTVRFPSPAHRVLLQHPLLQEMNILRWFFTMASGFRIQLKQQQWHRRHLRAVGREFLQPP